VRARAPIALLLLLATAPARATSYSVPVLPVSMAFIPDPSSKFCLSQELRDRIRPYFLAFDAASGSLPPDLTLNCSAYEDGKVKFTVSDGAGRTVDEFKARYESASTFDSTAFLVARRLETGKKTIRAALAAYQADVRYSFAKLGSADFAAGNWDLAAYRLYRALESGAGDDIFYFGLYASHARLGHAAQARWYLLAYSESSGKRPSHLSSTQLSYLRNMPRPADSDSLPEPVDLSEWHRLRDARQWGRAMDELKNVIEKAPWAVEAYDALADCYKAVGWETLEEVWRGRARIARKTANDRRLHKDLLDALQSD
jgi:hypothetical protein